jgi:hypothetical protein
MVELGIEPGTSWLVVRSSDHQTTRLYGIFDRKKVAVEQSAHIIIIQYSV